MCVLVVSISIFLTSFSCGFTVMAFAAQKIGSKRSVVICTKMSSDVIISDLLFHQKQMKAYEDVGSLGLTPGCIRTTSLSMCCFPVGRNYPEGVLKNLQPEWRNK